ncbi:MAG TPA: DUF5916 domain-containing protein [Gemmatimonadales bacterium]|nr:DUF5916 domain-containing protein [Gemmatimonadales bacterium]
MLILSVTAALVQGAVTLPPQGTDGARAVPTVSAVRVDRSPVVDGRLDDAAWNSAALVSGLVQSDPDEGRAVSESTAVRVVYDGTALYIGARMFDRDPDGIVRLLGRRDVVTPSDEFRLMLDTYHDRRTSFLFAVSSSGVQRDAVAGDDAGDFDESWDAVWQSAVTIDSLGWTVEMRIPFSQLRFSKAASQVWGVRFVRWIQRKNELALYPFVAKTESGVASRFAQLVGLRDLHDVRGLEILPYTVARQRFDRPEANNPFDDGHTVFGGAGLDVKAGLSPSFKLDLTVNPDFGQVELDPAFVNLSAFEQFLTEHRPFFTEGSSLFSFGSTGGGISPRFDTPLLFYSRRIGRPPQGEPTSSGDFTDAPEATTILGAAKLSGKTASGWSVGAVEALTAREFATVADSASAPHYRDEVEPFTNYFASRVKRDFAAGNTTLGFVGTGVQRSIDQPALKFLSSGAYAGGVDFLHRWGDRAYSLAASVSGSLVHGDTAAINQFQEASDRYYQRPDARHYRFDSTATSLSGLAADVYLNKVGGNWVWSLAANTMTPGFEVNDLGFQERVDIASLFGAAGYKWTRPGRVFRVAYGYLSTKSSWNYDGDLIQRSYNGYVFGRFRNFWEADFSLTINSQVLDDRLTRGGLLASKPSAFTAAAEAYTDNRKTVSAYTYESYSRNKVGGWYLSALQSVTARPSKSLSLSFGLGYEAGWSAAQYVQTVSDSTAVLTLGSRYVFAAIRQRSAYATLKVNAAFSRTLSLQLYAQPFTFIGAYDRFSELYKPRTYYFSQYGVNNHSTIVNNGDTYTVDPDGPGPAQSFDIYNPNFRERSFRSNAVLRWEYRPGSTIFLVWSQTRYGYFTDVNHGLVGDLGQATFRDRPTHVLQIKVNYWLRH